MTTDYLLGQPLALPPGTHLLANRDLIEDQWNIAWQLGRPELLDEPLILPLSPWEGAQGPAKVLRDRETGRYRMWYTVVHPISYRHFFMRAPDPGPLPGAYCVGYAESNDGLHWHKPELDIWQTPDGQRTNIVFWGCHGGQMGDVLEEVPGGKARFAMACLDLASGIEGLCLAWSDDGIRWERDPANPVLPCMSDCQNNIVFNPRLGRYVLITRPYPHASGIYEWDPPGHRHMRRRVAVSTSENLRDWTPIRVILFPEQGDQPDFDHMTAMAYGNGYVGFLASFDGDAGVEQRMTVHLALSSDGLHWHRQRQTPFLEPGFSRRGFDERSAMACGAWLPLDERRMLLFYAGRAQPTAGDPLSAVGRLAAMTLRRDGFVAATPGQRGPTVVRDNATGEQRQAPAGDASGYLLTREFILPAGGLTVNADARRGAVRVEVVDRASTKPYPGFARGDCLPLTGDDIAAPVRWQHADITTLAGRPVMLRFILEPGARLYAMRMDTNDPERTRMNKDTNSLTIGSRRELFIDPYLIERFEGAALRLHPPQPQEISISFDEPWEAGAPGYCTIFQDGARCRMYYRVPPPGGCEDQDPRQMTAYAESVDGLHWEKPKLRLIEVNGSTANNVIWRGVTSHNFTPFLDANPACPPAERYKAVGGTKIEWGGKGLWLLVSADGIHWRKRDTTPIAFPGNYDSQNLLFWDATAGCYRAYWRAGRYKDPRVPNGRDVLVAVSADLTTWSEPRWLEYDPNRSGSAELDQTDDPSGDHHQFYTSGVLPYPRAPHLFLGFPQRYCDRGWLATTGLLPDPEHRRRQADKGIGGGRPTRCGTVVTDVLFMASRDGVAFHVWPEALVRPGIQRPGSWYYGGAWFTWGMLQTPSPLPGAPNELSIYIQERFAPETPGRLRRHTFRMDGFGSLNAPLTGGRAVTKPFTFDGDRLSINFSTSGGGRLRIGLQDGNGADLPGFALADCDLQYGDELARIVSWQGRRDVGALRGRPVRLAIELKDADLYSFVFTPAGLKNHE